MSRLPRITGKEMLRALQRAGFMVVRVRGSHYFLNHPENPTRWATVPAHGKEVLSPKVVGSILKSTGLSPEELRALL